MGSAVSRWRPVSARTLTGERFTIRALFRSSPEFVLIVNVILRKRHCARVTLCENEWDCSEMILCENDILRKWHCAKMTSCENYIVRMWPNSSRCHSASIKTSGRNIVRIGCRISQNVAFAKRDIFKILHSWNVSAFTVKSAYDILRNVILPVWHYASSNSSNARYVNEVLEYARNNPHAINLLNIMGDVQEVRNMENIVTRYVPKSECNSYFPSPRTLSSKRREGPWDFSR